MKFIINSKILSLPPYISTSWDNITSLHVEDEGQQKVLMVFLTSGMQIKIPGLDIKLIDAIFTQHARFLDQGAPGKITGQTQGSLGGETLLLTPFKLGELSLDALQNFMHHNGEQKNAPNLPADVIEKLTHMLKTLPEEEFKHLPKPEPHCNCFYCQITKNIQNDETAIEEEVSEDDLRFKTWDVLQKDDKVFVATNPLDKSEAYQVFLGDPVCCTCGKKKCEHIEAVLRS